VQQSSGNAGVSRMAAAFEAVDESVCLRDNNILLGTVHHAHRYSKSSLKLQMLSQNKQFDL
jgi:hypothetical protein